MRVDTLLVVDDCTLHRDAVANMLSHSGVSRVDVVSDADALARTVKSAEPQVILVNAATRDVDRFLRAVTTANCRVPVVAVAVSDSDESGIIACAEAGVAGYHMRGDSVEDLLGLINDVAAGNVSCPPRISAMLLKRLSALADQRQSPVKDLVLTTREAQILRMLELGRSNQDIADHLSIAVHTVKNHVHSLLNKLGVNTRAQAAALSYSVVTELKPRRRARSRPTGN